VEKAKFLPPPEIREGIAQKLGEDPSSVIDERWGLKEGESTSKYDDKEYLKKIRNEMDEFGLTAREEVEIILRLKILGYYP